MNVRNERRCFFPAFHGPLPGHPEPELLPRSTLAMFRAKTLRHSQGSSATSPAAPSPALEWLWQNFRDVKHPHILDCGPAYQATLDVLLKRGAKLYFTDLIALAWQADPKFIRRLGKTTVFLLDDFIENLPPIPPQSLSAIACWHLLDLLPREALPGLVTKLWSYIRPGGVLFCLLREPSLANGAGTRWWFESLLALRSDEESKLPFPYPALTNREIERLVPSSNVKTFLTRSARREILAIK